MTVAENEALRCPVCGKELPDSFVCECGYDRRNNEIIVKTVKNDAALYRMLSDSDTYFAKKNYNEAYIGYTSVLDADPHCNKAVFRANIISQYLMYETSSVYLGSDPFFERTGEMITAAIENSKDTKFILMMCKDTLDLIEYVSEYERKYALSHKNEHNASEYIKHMLKLLKCTQLIMKCIICVNDESYSFVAMKCYSTSSEIYDRLSKGMEYYKVSERSDDSEAAGTDIMLREMSVSEKENAEQIFGDISDIRRRILKSADDDLYGKLKALDKDHTEIKTDGLSEELRREEHEKWRKNNEKEFTSADKMNMIFGILSKTFFVFSGVMLLIFIFIVLLYDEAVGIIIGSAAVFAALGGVFTALEKFFGKRRSFYAGIVCGDIGEEEIGEKLRA